MDSTESKNGFPTPGFTPKIAHSIVPPIESLSLLAFIISSLIEASKLVFINGSSFPLNEFNNSSFISVSKKLLSFMLPIELTCAAITIPFDSNICLQIAPANTNGAVILPEKCPPPL